MKNPFILLYFTALLSTIAAAQNPLFDDTQLPSIYIEMPQDSFNYMVGNLINTRYLHARFIFVYGNPTQRDTVETTGIRLRGNTSLVSQKKSFKLSFNEFESGRRYRGLKKLNLNGSHNDPTMIREKLFYDVWNKADLPKRRVSFVKLYVNGAYRGLYSNVEEIDKEWLERNFPDKNGNLYKCTWPADLAPLGPSQAPYKAILNTPDTRAYDLVTNETADDYSDFVHFVLELNKPPLGSFETDIQQVLNVQAYLKALAVEVAAGHWDDYTYNKNNYYLYDNPTTGRFEFISYDADNTFGVDWLGQDWATRNVYTWAQTGQPRPLTTQVLSVPAFKQAYTRYLDTLAREILHPDSIIPRVNYLHNLISDAAAAGTWRSLDFGYTLADFHAGFYAPVDGHTPYGIIPFLVLRRDSILAQIAMMLPPVATHETALENWGQVFPNPFSERLWLELGDSKQGEMLLLEWVDMYGRVVQTMEVQTTNAPIELPVSTFPPGFYWIRIQADGKCCGEIPVFRN